MLEERVRVVRCEPGFAWVRALDAAQCQRCASGQGCGGSWLIRRRPDAPARHTLSDLRAGEQVVVGLPEDALLKASLLIYLPPLLGLFSVGGFGHAVLRAAPGWVAGFGLAGLLLGLGVTRVLAQRVQDDPQLQLRVLARAGQQQQLAQGCARAPSLTLGGGR